jgi:hypothetical protein
MSGYYDVLTGAEQQQLDQQQTASNARLYNADGSGKANDYLPPKLPESDFPPAPAASKDLTFNLDQLHAVATQMRYDLSQLEGTLRQLNGAGDGGAKIGGWSTAEAFGFNASNAYQAISLLYQQLNSAYDDVIGSLQQTAGNYGDAESATVTAAHGVSSEVGTTGTLGNY